MKSKCINYYSGQWPQIRKLSQKYNTIRSEICNDLHGEAQTRDCTKLVVQFTSCLSIAPTIQITFVAILRGSATNRIGGGAMAPPQFLEKINEFLKFTIHF